MRVALLALIGACGGNGNTDVDAGTDAMVDAAPNPPTSGYFKASNAGSEDAFGKAIALSADGTTLVVGAPTEDSAATGVNSTQDDESAMEAGAAYVFVRSGGVWVQEAYLKASNTDAGDQFGYTVAASGDGRTVAVQGYYESSCSGGIDGDQSDDNCFSAGAVYVFTRDSAGTWSQEAYIKPSHAMAARAFGTALAFSSDGNTLAVGMPGDASPATGINNGLPSATGADLSGAAFVFTRTGSTWAQEAYVKASNTNAYDVFGVQIALSGTGDVMVVGATGEESNAMNVDGNQGDNSRMFAGAAYVFARSGTTWTQEAYLKASNTGSGDELGSAVAISEDGATIAVGAYGESSGDPQNPANNSQLKAGAVYIFRKTSTWTPEAYVKTSTPYNGDLFGYDVALSANGDALLVGRAGEDSDAPGIDGTASGTLLDDAGAVELFVRTGSSWAPLHGIQANYPESLDGFGSALGLSGDGKLVAVGAAYEDSKATGIDGDQMDDTLMNAGAAFAFALP